MAQALVSIPPPTPSYQYRPGFGQCHSFSPLHGDQMIEVLHEIDRCATLWRDPAWSSPLSQPVQSLSCTVIKICVSLCCGITWIIVIYQFSPPPPTGRRVCGPKPPRSQLKQSWDAPRVLHAHLHRPQIPRVYPATPAVRPCHGTGTIERESEMTFRPQLIQQRCKRSRHPQVGSGRKFTTRSSYTIQKTYSRRLTMLNKWGPSGGVTSVALSFTSPALIPR